MDIKQCPFCGGRAVTNVLITSVGGGTDAVAFSVMCEECGTLKTVRLKIGNECSFEGVEKAIRQVKEIWNRRAVLRGEWIEEDGCMVCSECGTTDEINPISGEYMNSNFCAECGADMRGGA